MRAGEIRRVLEHVPGVEVAEPGGDRVEIRVPAIGDAARLDCARVARAQRMFAPDGDPAVEFVVSGDGGPRPLIVVPTDVVFAPAAPEAVLDSAIPYRIAQAPHLVAYSEMERDAQGLARILDEPDGRRGLDLDQLAATLLLTRCFIAGAGDLGLRPVRSAGWWHAAWSVVGEELPLPPFRTDTRWEELVRAATRIELRAPLPTPHERADTAAVVAALTLDDFRRTAPALSFGRLDETFLTAWKAHVPATPAQLATALLDGVAGGRAVVDLYPDGGGGIDLRMERDGSLLALLQLRFPAGGDGLAVDEIRIAEPARHTGTFQRLMFRAEQTARLLHRGHLSLLATGSGSYAIAALGMYPLDPALRRGLGADRAGQ
jgi:hypothetical protein